MYIRKASLNDINKIYQIFLQNYKEESQRSPMLPHPDQFLSGEGSLDKLLTDFIKRDSLIYPAYVLFDSDREEKMLGFMITGYVFTFKGQKAAMVPEFCHGAVGNQKKKERIYQRLYQICSQTWVDRGCSLHLIGSFYHDEITKNILFYLGFGAIIAERLRDLSPIYSDSSQSDLPVIISTDITELVEIEREHKLFYPKSPIYISKSTDRNQILSDLQNFHKRGDPIFIYRDKGEVQGYLIAGESEEDGEGFLLRHTNTAQIKSAFVRPEYRGKEVGASLLQRAVEWSREQGYNRILVEHETANIFGGNFWAKHFDPYLVFSMRYIDNTILTM